jgi:SRSO17 transposase
MHRSEAATPRVTRYSATASWVTADCVYGADHRIRRRLEARQRGYVLAVTSRQRLGFIPVTRWLAKVSPEGWQRLSAGDGAKGPRLYDWAYLSQGAAAPGWCRGLLIRRSPTKPEDVVYYLVHAPEGSTLAQLVRVAGTRWTIESCFEAAKSEVGLDQYEVRSWTGWHRHITLAMLAHAYLAVLRKAANGGRGSARPRRRAAAYDRTGSPPPALAPALGSATQTRYCAPLVSLAQTTSPRRIHARPR